MAKPAAVSLVMNSGGWYVEWYRDDDNNSGYGDHAEICVWYGPHDACVVRMKMDPPKRGWVKLSECLGSPPHDSATATGMYDGF